MGGKRQANVLSALIQNFDTAEKAIEASANSAGSALRENEVYLDSIQGRIDLFTNSVQTMWQNTLDSDVIKWFVDLGTTLIKVVDTLGLIPSILLAIVAYKGLSHLFKGFDIVSWIRNITTLTMGTKVFDAETRKAALSLMGEQLQLKLTNSALVQYAIKMGLATSADVAKMTTTQLLGLSFKALGVAVWNATKAIAAFLFTNPVGWVILAIGAIAGGIAIFNHFHKTTEELQEELNELKSGLQDIQTELESVGSELETTQDRMAELLALPSLSFIEQEELDRLKEQNEELERRERLLKAEEEREKKRVAEKAAETVDSQLNDLDAEWSDWLIGIGGAGATGAASGALIGSIVPGIGTAIGAIAGGIIGAATGGIAVATGSETTEDKLNEEIESYESLIARRAELEKKLTTASDEGTGLFGWGKSEYDKTKEELEELEKEIEETEAYIDGTLGELGETLKGVEYGYGADEALDKYYNALYKWEIEFGTIGAKSDGLAHIFSRPEHKTLKEGVDNYIASLKEGESASREEIEKIIANNDALVADLQAMGLEISDAVDYFTMVGSGFNNTPEGIMAQYQTAKQVLEDLKNQKINLDDLVEYDADTNQATAKVDKIAEHLKGVGPDIQKEFAKIIEDVKEGTLDYEKAFDRLDIYSMQSMVAFAKTQLESANKIAFPDLEISGWLDSVEELSGAFDSLATSMDLVVRAQEQMDSSGRISLKTALDLMASTDEWNKILEVNNGVITMNANAEQILIQSKLDLIKANIDAAIADVETQITLMEGAINSHEAGNTFTEGFTNALVECQGIMVGLKAGWDAFWSGEDVGQAFNDARNAAIKNLKPTEQDLTGLYQQKAELEKKKEMLTSVDTTQEFKNNYDFNKTPGDKYGDDPETKTKNGWEELISKYENKLALITNERDLIEAEIDKMEAQGGQASEEAYADLIRSQLEEKKLLEERKKELEDYLKIHKDSIDPETWTEYNNEINETAVAIKECTTNISEFAQELREIDMHYFEQTIDELSRLGEEIDFIMSLFEDEEMVNEDGSWTDAGITKINLLRDQMTLYAAIANEYGKQIAELETLTPNEDGTYAFGETFYNNIRSSLDTQLKDGLISQDTYNEMLKELDDAYANGGFSAELYAEWMNELVDGQRDAITSGKEARDGLIELNEARIDAIESGIEKEIEAYEDYIDVVKEALDAERDLYDFKNNIQKQTKDIASLERRIAALSGSTNASDIATRRKLEAELLEAKEGLNDTYYDHSRDQQSQALDDEAEAFSNSKEKYIESLREYAKDTEAVINDMLLNGIFNADVADEFLTNIQNTYGTPLSSKLTEPWGLAAEQARLYKDSVGIITGTDIPPYVVTLSDKIISELGLGTEKDPWGKATNAAKTYADFLTGNDFTLPSSQLTTFNQELKAIIEKWIAVKDAANDAYEAQSREVTVGGNPNVGNTPTGDGNQNNKTNNNGGGAQSDPKVKALQEVLNSVFSAGLATDGIWGSKTQSALKKAQENVKNFLGRSGYRDLLTVNGKFDAKTRQNMLTYFDKMANAAQSNDHPESVSIYTNAKKKLPVAFHAKGTLGTSRDEWAITDEIGDELVLVPGANGNLSFMRKGTSVVPAEITQNLVEWGKLNPDMLKVGGGANINMISNAVNKPEFNFDVENFLKVERVDKDTLPELEKMMDKKIDNLVKQMNYALRGKGAR